MSSRSNKKRKPRKDPTNRERTVTTLTGAPNTDYLVPVTSEEPPAFNAPAKMQGTMGTPYQVQHSPNFQYHAGRPPGGNGAGYAPFDTMNTMQHLQSQPNTFYGPAGTQHQQQPGGHTSSTNAPPGRSQENNPPPRLPPGKNDLEILENLKRIIKEGQHPFYRAVPQPAALARLYKGVIPVSDSKETDSTENGSAQKPQKDTESAQVTQVENGTRTSASATVGGRSGSNERERYSPGSQRLNELNVSANASNGPGAPPPSAGSTQDSRRDHGPPPNSAFSSSSITMPDDASRHDEPYDPTRARDYYSAPHHPSRPNSVYERPSAGYTEKDFAYDPKEPLAPRRAAWGGPPSRSDRDQGYDSRPPPGSDTRPPISFGPPPSFPHGVEFGGNGIPSQQRHQAGPNDSSRALGKRRDDSDSQLEPIVDPNIERSLYIPDLAPGQTDPAELRPLIEKAREEKRKNKVGASGALGARAAYTATESRPLPTGTMPTEGASTLRDSEIPAAQRAAEAAAAAAEGDDNDIRSSRASSGGSPRITSFTVPVSPPIIPFAGIDVPLPTKNLLLEALENQPETANNDDDTQPIKIERPPYGRQFYGSLPPGETALDIGSLAPLVLEMQRQHENRQNANASATAASGSGAASSSGTIRAPQAPQEYPPAPGSETRRHPQDSSQPDAGPPPPPPPARYEGRERDRYPRDAPRDSRDSRDASPAAHAPRRYPPPPPVSPPGSVRGGPHAHEGPDRDRDREWQYHHHAYPRRERWGDHWDPSEPYSRDYPPPPPRSGGWDPRDREYPPREYPPGPPVDDRDRSYAPPIDDRRDRPPGGPYNPPYGRVRHRSPSPPPRRAGGPPPDDFRPPTKRPRDDYGDYYTPAPPPARDLPPPHRRGMGDHYPPLPPRAGSPPHGPPPSSSSWPPPPPSSGGLSADRDRDRDRDLRGRDYRHGPLEYPPPPPHGHSHQHDAYTRPRSPPHHGPPPPGPGRPYGRGGYAGRGDRYPPPRP
ncbi:hypothetical protein CVT24_008756 [Panaeolus cyanescens]|uniref:Uncharacterized protein n=1 Tax=Panaeolus cyanescens TaxID=181874 RepID=A0A409YX36_9AGAR|nr:hypothetical protein CVT24_008756 [Panaeolus cyanescens]